MTIRNCSACRSICWNTHLRRWYILVHWPPWRTLSRWERLWCCRTATSYSNRARSSTPDLGCRRGRVLIYLHKERVLDHVQKRYPAAHYVMVDDKPNLLAAMKSVLGAKLTTVFVRQGHYALAAQSNAGQPAPDRVIERIVSCRNSAFQTFR